MNKQNNKIFKIDDLLNNKNNDNELYGRTTSSGRNDIGRVEGSKAQRMRKGYRGSASEIQTGAGSEGEGQEGVRYFIDNYYCLFLPRF